tara:strand:+ start:988 stop:1638 length:651 start_codon:yes stop_codon:yes gene_type:complete
MNRIKIAPSILSADFSRLGDEIEALDTARADIIHIDVMDGHFVNNLTLGPALIKSIRNRTNLPFDVHLMIDPVYPYIKDYIDAGADIVSFHVEVQEDIAKTINKVKSFNKKVGLAINPDSDIKILEPFIDFIDQIIFMTVYPGFAGQEFIPKVLEKVQLARQLIGDRLVEIEIDGGVNANNAKYCIDAGATILVAGASVFSDNNYRRNIDLITSSL